MLKKFIPQMTTFGKWSVIILLAFILIWPLTVGVYWGLYKGYTAVDATRFPWSSSDIHSILDQTKPNSAEPKKGIALSAALSNRLEEEMGSAFGWSVNDLIVSPTRWLDNRANRQRGVIFATRMLINFFSTNLAKYGTVDAENEFLKDAREKYFAFSEASWWFPSTESQYREGLGLRGTLTEKGRPRRFAARRIHHATIPVPHASLRHHQGQTRAGGFPPPKANIVKA